MNEHPKPRPFLVYLLIVFAFLAGVMLDRTGLLPGSLPAPAPGLRQTFAPFWETWNLVDRHYVDREAVEPVRMTRGAIQGMLDSLGDVGHTTYLSPEEVEHLEESLKGSFEGIGARMTVRKGRPTIVDLLPNSPAEQAGLKPGDILAEIDGKEIASVPLTRVVQLVRGPSGTTVHLRVLREGTGKPLDIDVRRGTVQIADVGWQLLPGTSIAHIAMHEFGVHADQQLRATIEEARTSGARGLLIDMRGNPGGLKDQAIEVTSEFLKEGTVFIEQDAQGKRTPMLVKPGGIATEIPVVVLIDEGTASSAEIFAGALQDYERARLVGTKTFGTGTVLEPFGLSDGSAVLMAVTEWFTPKGRQIWHKGIEPDIEVTLPAEATLLMPERGRNLTEADLKKSSDRQLLRGLQELQEQVKKRRSAAAAATE